MLYDKFFIDDNEIEDKEQFVLIYHTITDLGGYNLGVVYN
jgi:hypothetical protein